MKKTLDIKKLVLLNMPYILLGLFATNFGEAWRMAQGADASEKFLSLIAVLPGALESFWPSLHPLDLLVGLCCGGSLRLAVYLKELLSYTQGSKEDGEKDAIDCLMEDTVSRTHRHREYYNNYQRYQLMQVDKERVIMACNIIINDLIGRLYRYDYRFGYDITLASEHSIAKKLSDNWQNEWEVEDYEAGDC